MRAAFAAAMLAAGCLFVLPATAQEPVVAQDKQIDAGRCLPHATLVDYLDRAFDESRIATAAMDEGQPAELYASRRGTWTLVEIHQNGMGCIRAYGEQFHLERKVS